MSIPSPAEGWSGPSFDDASWAVGRGGFGTEGTPGASVGTTWDGPDIWLRRSFELRQVPSDVELLIHHDEDAEIFINGHLVARLEGYTTSYILHPLDEKGVAALKRGNNVVAVHCHQTTGGQYIDVGLVNLIDQPVK